MKKITKQRLFVVGLAFVAVVLPDLAMATNAVTGAGETAVSDSSIANAIDAYTAYISDIDKKSLAVYKPFMAASATVMGAGFVVRRIFK